MSQKKLTHQEQSLGPFNHTMMPTLEKSDAAVLGPLVVKAYPVRNGTIEPKPRLFINKSLSNNDVKEMLRDKPEIRILRNAESALSLIAIPVALYSLFCLATLAFNGFIWWASRDESQKVLRESSIHWSAENLLGGALGLLAIWAASLLVRQIAPGKNTQWEERYLDNWPNLHQRLERLDDSVETFTNLDVIEGKVLELNAAHRRASIVSGQPQATRVLRQQGAEHLHQFFRLLPEIPLGREALAAEDIDDPLIKNIAKQQSLRIQERAELLKAFRQVIDQLDELNRHHRKLDLVQRAHAIYDIKDGELADASHPTPSTTIPRVTSSEREES